MPLTDDQRAMLQLLLERGQSYDDIASLLGLDVDDVRGRARSALAEIGGADPDSEVGLTDYLLGQADPIGRADVARQLQSDGETHELAEKLRSQLQLIAPRAELPELPAARARPAKPEPASAKAEERPGFAASLTAGQRRLIAALGGGALLIVIIVLLATGTFSGGGSDNGGKPSATTPGGTAASDQLTQARLTAVGGGKASGIALFEQAQKVGPVLNIKVFNLPQTSSSERYGFWLVGKSVAVPLNSAKEDQRGGINATIPIPVEYLAFLQSGAVNEVAVSKTTAPEFAAAAKKTVTLIKALKTGKRKAPIPNIVGQVVVRGPITGPGFTSGSGGSTSGSGATGGGGNG